MPPWLIFSDLDGTLLDARTHSYQPALSGLNAIKKQGVPLVLCTSKTLPEMKLWNDRLGVCDPFVVENGGALVFPCSWIPWLDGGVKQRGDFLVMEIGPPHAEVLEALNTLADRAGIRVKGLSAMGEGEAKRLLDLSNGEAAFARRREYSEPFIMEEASQEALDRFHHLVRGAGMSYTRGRRFHYLLGSTNKGRAVQILGRLFANRFGDLTTVGIGDSQNDFSMLEAVDIPVLVQGPDGTYTEPPNGPRCYLAPGRGPCGWSRAVETLIVNAHLPEDWIAAPRRPPVEKP